MKSYNALCKPAKFYFIISLIFFTFNLIQNIGNQGTFTIGAYSCPHLLTGWILMVQALYIIGFTWLLNLICSVSKTVSWVIVLLPFIIQFIALGLIIFHGNSSEQFSMFSSGNGTLAQASL
jgi:hypothetical protein